MKLKYTGPSAVVFLTGGIGEVGPDGVFTVPDDVAETYVRRSDVEAVEEKRPARKPKGAVPVTAPTTEEIDAAVLTAEPVDSSGS